MRYKAGDGPRWFDELDLEPDIREQESEAVLRPSLEVVRFLVESTKKRDGGDQRPTRAQDPGTLIHRGDRVRHMLKHLATQNSVI